MTLPSSHRPPHLSGQTLLLRVDFVVDFWPFLLVFRPILVKNGQNRPRNRLLLEGLLRVLGGAEEGVCGWKSGHNDSTARFGDGNQWWRQLSS